MTSSFLSQLELVRLPQLRRPASSRLRTRRETADDAAADRRDVDVAVLRAGGRRAASASSRQWAALVVPARSTGRAPKRRRGRGRHKRRSSAIPQAVRRVPSAAAAAAPRRGSSARRSVRCGLLWPGLNSRGPRQVPAWLRCAGIMCSCSESHLGGSTWLAYDANSGGHATRIHARSIAGYTIVNPHATRVAFAWRV